MQRGTAEYLFRGAALVPRPGFRLAGLVRLRCQRLPDNGGQSRPTDLRPEDGGRCDMTGLHGRYMTT